MKRPLFYEYLKLNHRYTICMHCKCTHSAFISKIWAANGNKDHEVPIVKSIVNTSFSSCQDIIVSIKRPVIKKFAQRKSWQFLYTAGSVI